METKRVNPNLRYKHGKNLNYNSTDVFEMADPSKFYLPKQNISSKYIFAKEDLYFVYQNNYNKYVNFYKNTYSAWRYFFRRNAFANNHY